jgi:1-phosphatidylinositol-3-phosphate 5-kinase
MLTTSSQDYELKLNGLKIPEQTLPPSVATNTPNFSHCSSHDGVPDQYLDSLSSANDIEAVLLKSTGTHLKYQFQEGSANFFCKIFYAEQFDALRINCGCDEHYIQSLSRCLKWDSAGGKSKSAFLKTLGLFHSALVLISRQPSSGKTNVQIRNGCVR